MSSDEPSTDNLIGSGEFINNLIYIRNNKMAEEVEKVEKEENWIDAMIEREALPKASRKETVEEFCSKWGVAESTYYYQSSKSDNWKKILEISLNSAKKECPEILKVLGDKAKSGDMKAVDMYLNYIVQLAKNLDIKTDGKEIKSITEINYIVPNGDKFEADNQTTPSLPSSE